MYTSFFGLAEKPFAITPDPRYLFLSERHAEALAHLLYGIEDAGGFVQLTGEVGTGKTTMVRSLLARVPDHADVALILNPRVTPLEFLLAVVDELHVPHAQSTRASPKALVDALNAFLLQAHAQGRRVVVIVDEAQQLPTDTLEQVRLLTNLETETRKLLQIILVGQPELRDVLARNDLRQLAQRITGRYHLDPLTAAETASYVRHRLKVAGATGEIFTDGALAELHRLSKGIPRVTNVIADRALLGAYTVEQHRVTPKLVREAASEVFGRPLAKTWPRWVLAGFGAAGALLLAFGLWLLLEPQRAPPAVAGTQPAGIVQPTAGTAAAPAPAPGTAPASASPPTSLPVGPGASAGTSIDASAAAREPLAPLLAANAARTGTDAAFARLFALWNAPFDPAGPRPCEQAAALGLECLAQRGALAQLRVLDRPAIVTLVLPGGAEHQVVVARLGDDAARLELGDRAVVADLGELQRYWFGDFLILWRPPVSTARALAPGMRGADVRWLRQGLQQARGEPPRTGGSDVYDGELVRLVEDFQRRHRLTVDGIAGRQTIVMLDAQLGAPGTPTLQASGG